MKKLLSVSSLFIVLSLQGCLPSLPAMRQATQGYYLCSQQKEYDLGIAELDEAIKLDPKYAPSYLFRGSCYEKKKDFSKALNDYATAVEIEPENYTYHVFRARVYAEMEQTDQAQKAYDIAVDLATKQGARDAYVHRGNFYANKVAKIDLALTDYQKSLQMLHSLPDNAKKTEESDIMSLIGIIKIQSKQGNTKEACEAFDEYKTRLKWDSITDKQKNTLTKPLNDDIKDCRK